LRTIFLEQDSHVVREPELLERRRLLRLVEDAHDDHLALDRRQQRDADVEQAPRRLRRERDAAVLWLSPLGDVELREHVEARRHRVREPPTARSSTCVGITSTAGPIDRDRSEVDVRQVVGGGKGPG